MQTISVRDVQGGWSVETDFAPFPLMFLSVDAAQRQADRFSALHSRQGESHHVLVYGRSGLIDRSHVELARLQVARSVGA